jgi:hypothetical protein
MSSASTSTRRRLATVGAVIALAVAAASCGSDEPTPEVPEGGTGSAFNDAIRASDSHDEVLIGGGVGEMLVAVECAPGAEAGADTVSNRVTVIAEGLDAAVYTGVFEPATDVDITLDATASGQASVAVDVVLDAEEYTVTFAEIDGGEFTVRGCTG